MMSRYNRLLEIICCPFCKSSLTKIEKSFICSNHGSFATDKYSRPFLLEQQILQDNSIEHVSGINWLKSFLKKYPKLYYSIWHIFCPVMMLVNGPKMILKYINPDSIVVDLGSGPERIDKEFINLDIFPFPEVDVVADATQLPFRDNSLDALVSEAAFEHVAESGQMAKEVIRVLRSGGYAYISVPFIQPFHASPNDFNRWTLPGLKHLFSDLEIIKSGVRSGPWSALLMFLAYWLGNVFSLGSKRAAPFLAHFFMLVLGPLKYPDYLFMKIPGAEVVSTQLFILGRKK